MDSREGVSPAKKPGGGLEEHVVLLRDGMETLYEKSEDMEWEDKFKAVVELLAEKNIVHFIAGVDICTTYLAKALSFRRKFIETHLIELLAPILKKYIHQTLVLGLTLLISVCG
jgi:hypothetical protein